VTLGEPELGEIPSKRAATLKKLRGGGKQKKGERGLESNAKIWNRGRKMKK